MDIHKIIVQSLIGKLDKSQQKYFANWLESHPDNTLFYEHLKKYWKFKEKDMDEKKKEVWSKINRQINLTKETNTVRIKSLKTIHLRRTYWIAASILLILSSVGIFSLLEQQVWKTVVSVSVEKKAAAGQKLSIRLPDGSQVKLNGESNIKYPETFSDSVREVYLTGEAFFEVEKDRSRPFIIHSAEIQTTVKGTSFNIKAYPNSETIEVAVLSGLVEVMRKNTSSKILLNRQEAVAYNRQSQNLGLLAFSESMTSWRNGVIIFDKADFKEIVEVLERWYGVKFVLNKKVDMGDGFIGRYENESLKTVMESLSYAGDFSFKIENKVLTLY
ncbi:FecR domain-containing protein [Fulvivirgaceae bacterium BMA10]|uniref:FecR domain-containing protein n=1 Tax=Splendidivirga corallicola TaxID=3051826 RepID=A0ABT8KK30_9BACT|nr:FecR domain-containing protein [Fulvivirgaceae bacterium BMA10]